MTTPKIQLAGVTKSFDGKQVLRGIDVAVEAQESLCISGTSGCGKSVSQWLLTARQIGIAAAFAKDRTPSIGKNHYWNRKSMNSLLSILPSRRDTVHNSQDLNRNEMRKMLCTMAKMKTETK